MFRSELVALKTAAEENSELRLKLSMKGAPINGPIDIFVIIKELFPILQKRSLY
jgi:hypothetical protein